MNSRSQYIKRIAAAVQADCKGTHLFPSVMIAQGCLESADGNSELAAKHNNHFGMKAGSHWKGATAVMKTKEYERGHPVMVNQEFRAYPDAAACFKDHVLMLQTVSVYKAAGLFECTTPEGQCNALRKAGYATDPAYPKKLVSIINENNLKQYDAQ